MAFTLGMILEARERLKGVAQRTGLVQFKALSDENSQIYLKTEDLQNRSEEHTSDSSHWNKSRMPSSA